MITKQALLHMVRHVVRRSEGYRDRRIMHPRRDWLIGLFGAVFLFLASAAVEGYLFWSKSSADADAVTLETVTYDQKLVRRVLTEYRSREARYKELLGASVGTPTPTNIATNTDAVPAAVSASTPAVAE